MVVVKYANIPLSTDDQLKKTPQTIVGVRYQCGHCPSKPVAYNLVMTIYLPELRID